ncbi:MAG: glycosyltransferase family 4 protein [Rhodobacteraceae bacterium]|jgi:glycosyltransferase involved in cell wall biosynthesis|nr:glycosyltransferase family 4 protein [Paracoccaceae bacterium]
MSDQPPPPPAFRPAGPAQGQVEKLARELHEVRARLLELDAATGHSAPPLRAPPIRIERPGFAPVAPAAPGVDGPAGGLPPPEDAAWWPRPQDSAPAMAPAPGPRCAGLAQRGLPAIAVSCCGLTEDQTARAIEDVVAEQMQTRAFVALYLTDDSRCLHLFRYQGLDVELVPAESDLAACPGALPPQVLLSRRMEGIRRTWGITDFRDLGTRPLPWPQSPEPASAPRPVVVFDRDYRRYNPYQHLLHVSVPGVTFRPGPIDHAIGLCASGRPTVFHLNWEEALYRPAADAAEAATIVQAFLQKMDDLRAGGGRVVWTVHNETPHEDLFPDVYRTLACGVARRCDLVIVHSRAAADIAVDRYGVPRDRVCLVPHGGYHDLYPADLSGAAARAALDLPETGVLFGFVGAVRPYKNVPLLLDAFRRLSVWREGQGLQDSPVRLMIAGQQMAPIDLAPDDPLRAHLVLRDGAIPDSALAAHVRACDAIVLPFERILTSGSMMLALSLGVPVIVPDLPGLAETLEDGVNGLMFPPGDADALAARMADVSAMAPGARDALSRNAATTARLRDWGWIGRQVGQRIHALFAPAAAGPVDVPVADGAALASAPSTPQRPVPADVPGRTRARRA